jgi:hypothetical protein
LTESNIIKYENETFDTREITKCFDSYKTIVFRNCIVTGKSKIRVKGDLKFLYFDNCVFCDDTIIQIDTPLEHFEIVDCMFGQTQICHIGKYKDACSSHEVEINIFQPCYSITVNQIFHDNRFEVYTNNETKVERLNINDAFIQRLDINGNFKEISISGDKHPEFDINELSDQYFSDIIEIDTKLDCAFGVINLDCRSSYVTINSDLVAKLKIDECNIENFYSETRKTNYIDIFESRLETSWIVSKYAIQQMKFVGNIHKDSYMSFKDIKVNRLVFANFINSGNIHLYNITSYGNDARVVFSSSDVGHTNYINCDFSTASIKYMNTLLDNGVYTGTKWPTKNNFSSRGKNNVEYSLRNMFTQIKNSYAKKNDRYNENIFYQYEMRTLKNELKREKVKNSFIDSLLINFNWITSDFGTNPLKSIISLLVFHLIFVSFIFYSNNIYDTESFVDFFSYSLNPVHRLSDNPIKSIVFTHTQSLIIKVYLATFLYQVVISLRKISRLQ